MPDKATSNDADYGKRLNEAGVLRDIQGEDLVRRVLSFAAPSSSPAEADGLMDMFKGIRGLFDASIDDLSSCGLSESGALLIKLLKGASSVYLRERMMGKDVSKRPEHAFDYLRLSLSGERVERFVAIYLNERHEAMAAEPLHEGTINQTAVYPRKAIESALRMRASSVIFAHNHPSGDPAPSEADIRLSHALEEAARSVGMKVHCHIIVGREINIRKGCP